MVTLANWTEFIAVLDGYISEKGTIIASLRKEPKIYRIVLPVNSILEGKSNLQNLVGRKIGILKTDSGFVIKEAKSNENIPEMIMEDDQK